MLQFQEDFYVFGDINIHLDLPSLNTRSFIIFSVVTCMLMIHKCTYHFHALFAVSHSEAADPAKVGSSVKSVTTGRIMIAPRVADFMFATIASLIVSERVVRHQIRRTLQSVPDISPMIATG